MQKSKKEEEEKTLGELLEILIWSADQLIKKNWRKTKKKFRKNILEKKILNDLISWLSETLEIWPDLI